jgi:hypothetical protein
MILPVCSTALHENESTLKQKKKKKKKKQPAPPLSQALKTGETVSWKQRLNTAHYMYYATDPIVHELTHAARRSRLHLRP